MSLVRSIQCQFAVVVLLVIWDRSVQLDELGFTSLSEHWVLALWQMSFIGACQCQNQLLFLNLYRFATWVLTEIEYNWRAFIGFS